MNGGDGMMVVLAVVLRAVVFWDGSLVCGGFDGLSGAEILKYLWRSLSDFCRLTFG